MRHSSDKKSPIKRSLKRSLMREARALAEFKFNLLAREVQMLKVANAREWEDESSLKETCLRAYRMWPVHSACSRLPVQDCR